MRGDLTSRLCCSFTSDHPTYDCSRTISFTGIEHPIKRSTRDTRLRLLSSWLSLRNFQVPPSDGDCPALITLYLRSTTKLQRLIRVWVKADRRYLFVSCHCFSLVCHSSRHGTHKTTFYWQGSKHIDGQTCCLGSSASWLGIASVKPGHRQAIDCLTLSASIRSGRRRVLMTS